MYVLNLIVINFVIYFMCNVDVCIFILSFKMIMYIYVCVVCLLYDVCLFVFYKLNCGCINMY